MKNVFLRVNAGRSDEQAGGVKLVMPFSFSESSVHGRVSALNLLLLFLFTFG
jgi:hypothetical protein